MAYKSLSKMRRQRSRNSTVQPTHRVRTECSIAGYKKASGDLSIEVHFGVELLAKIGWNTPVRVEMEYDADGSKLAVRRQADGGFNLYFQGEISGKKPKYAPQCARVVFMSFPGSPLDDFKDGLNVTYVQHEYDRFGDQLFLKIPRSE